MDNFEDYIIVKHMKNASVSYIIWFVLSTFFIFPYLIFVEKAEFHYLLFMCIMQLILLLAWNGDVRTMKFNRNGCEIRGLFYKKIYKWSEIKSIKYEYYSQYEYIHVKKRNFPDLKSCIVFSCEYEPKEDHVEPYHVASLDYKTFYVNFIRDDQNIEKEMKKQDYIIDEKLFLKKLKKWGIEVEGLNDPPKIW